MLFFNINGSYDEVICKTEDLIVLFAFCVIEKNIIRKTCRINARERERKKERKKNLRMKKWTNEPIKKREMKKRMHQKQKH